MIYVLGLMAMFAGLFAYGNQDQIRLFDAGESKMAEAILGRHGKMMTSCVMPGSADWCARDNSTAPLNPPVNRRLVSKYAVNDAIVGPAQAVDSIASVVQGQPGSFRLFTIGFVAGGVGQSRSETMTPALAASHLSRIVARYGEASADQRPAIFDAAQRKMRFSDRKAPRSVDFDPATAGMVIPDGAPAMVSAPLTTSLP